MIYSFTQISQFLTCPRRYRYRYLDGWLEHDKRASMLFGRAFEHALNAYFRREDPGETLFREWSAAKKEQLRYGNRDTWDRMFDQGLMLLTRFCQDDRVRVPWPRRSLQVKFTRRVGESNFVGYVDAIGRLDETHCVLEWKTSANRYAEKPDGLLALDPQLVCYSWLTGIPEVAQVIFIRKRLVEIQYLRTVITDTQRQQFERLVRNTIRRIEAAEFLPHSGIRFPQNPCTTCPYVGLCLGKQNMVDVNLVRRPGADLGWLDELAY
jgi:hypothetical protein